MAAELTPVSGESRGCFVGDAEELRRAWAWNVETRRGRRWRIWMANAAVPVQRYQQEAVRSGGREALVHLRGAGPRSGVCARQRRPVSGKR